MASSLNFYPPVIAHRGASAHAPENTMSAFIKAAQSGAKWIEFDVMQAIDGTPIIFHDALLDRTTNGRGEVAHYPYAYLRTLDAGSWFAPKFAGECIPSLEQIIDYLNNTKMAANIEIKAPPGKEERFIARLFHDLAPYLQKTPSPLLFSSFSIEALRLLRQYSADCFIGLLLHEWRPDWQEICTSLACASLHINEEIMTLPMAQKIKQLGKKLLCYTVNHPARAMQLYSFGVDAVFTDDPDKILTVVENKIQSENSI